MERTIDIYFSDLKEEVQEELLEMAGVESPEDMNWDIVPVGVLCVGTEDDK